MGIEKNIKNYLGKKLNVVPYYGLGWSPHPHTRSCKDNIPNNFEIKLTELYYEKNEIQGGIGIITTEGHEYKNHYFSFLVRSQSSYSILNKRSEYNVFISDSNEGYFRTCEVIAFKNHNIFTTGFAFVFYSSQPFPKTSTIPF